ncbi:hypothetical protein ACFLXU_04945 [Chloroflexota bacterium]
MKVSLAELIDSLVEKNRVLGSTDRYVRRALPIDQADEEALCFCSREGDQALNMIRSSRAKVIVCSDELEFSGADIQDKTLIQVSNPRLIYIHLLQKYFMPAPKYGIHPSAIIDEKARIASQVYIGPHSCIGNCEIGQGTVIDSNVYIHDNTSIGKGVIIYPGAVIGSVTVAFERNENGKLEKFPQLDRVVIEDNVEIGSNSCICRGTLPRSDTLIGQGTKVDTLVHIGHGVRIGKHCMIVTGAVICGSVRIGDYTWIAPQACIKEGITVGSRALVGMGSVVLKDIPDNTTVFGSPAKPANENVSKV